MNTREVLSHSRRVRFLCQGDRTELRFVVGDRFLEHGKKIFRMHRRDGDDRLCPGLVDLREWWRNMNVNSSSLYAIWIMLL